MRYSARICQSPVPRLSQEAVVGWFAPPELLQLLPLIRYAFALFGHDYGHLLCRWSSVVSVSFLVAHGALHRRGCLGASVDIAGQPRYFYFYFMAKLDFIISLAASLEIIYYYIADFESLPVASMPLLDIVHAYRHCQALLFSHTRITWSFQLSFTRGLKYFAIFLAKYLPVIYDDIL